MWMCVCVVSFSSFQSPIGIFTSDHLIFDPCVYLQASCDWLGVFGLLCDFIRAYIFYLNCSTNHTWTWNNVQRSMHTVRSSVVKFGANWMRCVSFGSFTWCICTYPIPNVCVCVWLLVCARTIVCYLFENIKDHLVQLRRR